MRRTLPVLALLLTIQAVHAQGHELRLPKREASAVGGVEFANEISGLPLREREDKIWHEVTSGNVPDFLRRLTPVPVAADIDGSQKKGLIYVSPDYLAVGSNDDYFFVPLTPFTAQRIADRLGCTLPTPRMVDSIYQAAAVKLTPSPIPPTPAMTTVPVFMDHNLTVGKQRV